MSAGETDLAALLAALEVVRRPGLWVFETGPSAPDLTNAAMAFREVEGWTAVRPATPADGQGFAWLELAVASSLEAVGFLAAVSGALAGAGIPCNAVAAYHHDHVFVPAAMADRAIAAIEALRTPR